MNTQYYFLPWYRKLWIDLVTGPLVWHHWKQILGLVGYMVMLAAVHAFGRFMGWL